jgi:glutamate 5-kinase
MQDLVRREVIETAQTIVVKVGSNVLTDDQDRIEIARLEHLAEQLCRIRQAGRRVVLVSSGAVSAGMQLLGLGSRPKDLPHLQAAASAGQAQLIHHYDAALKKHGFHAAQILVTGNDFKHRHRYLNVRNTLNTLFEYDVIPIVNENDTVSVEEIKFGDNDHLAAMVCNLLPEPLLVMLTSVDGLYDGDPGDPGSRVIPLVSKWEDSLSEYARPVKTSRGTGGMFSKLAAVRMATRVGECAILANGKTPAILDRILRSEPVGTLFLAEGRSLPAWKRWIGFTVPPKGVFELDEGAIKAIRERGTSLLAIGIVDVRGKFEAGELVSLVDSEGREFARGLSNFDSDAAFRIRRKRIEEMIQVLGDLPYKEVIHRDNLVVVT